MKRFELINKLLAPADMIVGKTYNLLKELPVFELTRQYSYGFITRLLKLQYSLTNQIEIIGADNIPATGGLILAVNHQSWFDATVVASSCPRRVCFLAKAMLFDFPFLKYLMDFAESIKLERKTGSGLENAIIRLKYGRVVVIFPEGTIPGEEEVQRDQLEAETGLLPGKTGAVRLSMITGAPIVPVGLTGTGLAFPPEMYPRLEMLPLPKNNKITIRFGEPIRYSQKLETIDKEQLRQMTDQLMKKISSLVDHSQNFWPIDVPMQKTEPISYKLNGRKKKEPLGVLALHGYTSSLKTISGLVPVLEKQDIPYLFPVLRGHGTDYKALKGLQSEDWLKDARQALLELNKKCQQIIVVGFSMGGLLALDLGIEFEKVVKGLVLVAPALKFVSPLVHLTPFLEKLFPFWDSPTAFNCSQLASENRNYPRFATDSFQSLLQYSNDIQTRLGQFSHPLLLLHSKKDKVISPDSARIILEGVNSTEKEVVWFDHSGHEMMQDCESDMVFKTIDGFISSFK